MNLEILCINLPSREDRKLLMLEKAKKIGIKLKFLEGIQGRDFEYNEFPCYDRKRRLKYYPDLSKGQLGCAASFHKAFDLFLSDSTADFLLVLEDDAEFPNHFLKILDTLVNRRKGWDIVRFQRSRKQIGMIVDEIEGYQFIFPIMVGMNNTGLLLRRTAVEKVIPLFRKHIFPADHILKFAHFKGVYTYEVTTNLLTQDKSTAGDTDTHFIPYKDGISLFRKLEMKSYRILGQGIRLFLMPFAYLRWKKVK